MKKFFKKSEYWNQYISIKHQASYVPHLFQSSFSYNQIQNKQPPRYYFQNATKFTKVYVLTYLLMSCSSNAFKHCSTKINLEWLNFNCYNPVVTSDGQTHVRDICVRTTLANGSYAAILHPEWHSSKKL